MIFFVLPSVFFLALLIWMKVIVPSPDSYYIPHNIEEKMADTFSVMTIQEHQTTISNSALAKLSVAVVFLCLSLVADIAKYRQDGILSTLAFDVSWIALSVSAAIVIYTQLRRMSFPSYLGFSKNALYIYRPVTLKSLFSVSWCSSLTIIPIQEDTAISLSPGRNELFLSAPCKTTFIQERMVGKEKRSTSNAPTHIQLLDLEYARTVLSAIVEKCDLSNVEIVLAPKNAK